jgi:cytoskeleton protein RodZ
LGAPVFTKGYLRKYAELVHVPIDDVLADYYRMNRATGAPPVVGPRRPKESNPINPGPWIAVIVVLLLAAGLAWWWFNRPPSTAIPVTRGVSSIPQTLQPEPVDEAPTDSTGAQADDAAPAGNEVAVETASAATGAPASTAQEQQSAPPPDTRTGSPTTQLTLRFSGDCWTEVTDGNGNRLFFGLGTDGRNVTVSGMPPIRVLLGDNDNVGLQVNGVDYVVKPSELRGNTARLSIGGP